MDGYCDDEYMPFDWDEMPDTKSTKKVRFSKTSVVVLTASRREYKHAGVSVWWSRNELKQFYKDYCSEVYYNRKNSCCKNEGQ
mmetsp:Transcript_10831/g.16490  ORF Transcript_10831/g.16490 Transcript_10831/m.16490 type:complete len:83 (-) Transcript_10831:226-474(-)